MINFVIKMFDVDYHAVTEDIYRVGVQDTGRKEVQDEFSVVIYYCVPGVIAALIAAYDVIICGKQVDHAAFAFITPIDTYDCSQHFLLFSFLALNVNGIIHLISQIFCVVFEYLADFDEIVGGLLFGHACKTAFSDNSVYLFACYLEYWIVCDTV